jgi:hypothetical protein
MYIPIRRSFVTSLTRGAIFFDKCEPIAKLSQVTPEPILEQYSTTNHPSHDSAV